MLRSTLLSRTTTRGCSTSHRVLIQNRSILSTLVPKRLVLTRSGTSEEMNTETAEREYAALEAYQKSLPKLNPAQRARTLVRSSTFGVLSTLARGQEAGYPSGSVTEYVSDDQGSIIFCLSDLGSHKGDLKDSPKCSFTIMEKGFQGMQDARVNIIGSAVQVPHEETEAVRSLYLSKHPNSFWVDFGDFSWFRLQADSVMKIRMVGGFGMAGSISPEAYLTASPDPVAQFSAPVCGHMNADHGDATIAMMKHFAGITVDEATLMSLDSYGMDVSCLKDGTRFKCRLGFLEPVTDRKGIKDQIVAMTKLCK